MNAKQKIRKECDRLWKERVFEEWGDVCVCGQRAVQGHHFFPKGLYAHLRYEIENGVPICMRCHFIQKHMGDPAVVAGIIKARGQKWYQDLLLKSRKRPTGTFITLQYYEAIKKRLVETA